MKAVGVFFSWIGYAGLIVLRWTCFFYAAWDIFHRRWNDAMVDLALLALFIFWNWFAYTRYKKVNQIYLDSDVCESVNLIAGNAGKGTQDLVNGVLRGIFCHNLGPDKTKAVLRSELGIDIGPGDIFRKS